MKVMIGLEVTPEAMEKINEAIDAMRDKIGDVLAECLYVKNGEEIATVDVSRMIERALHRREMRGQGSQRA